MAIINAGKTDPNRILPMRYPWAWECYELGVANNWVPSEIPMQQDIEQWKSKKVLSDLERRIVMWNLGFFSTAESLTANNIVLSVYKHVTNPETRVALLRQAYEEALHTHTFVYCCDSLGLDPDDVYGAYKTIPSIREKDDLVVDLTKVIFDPNFETNSLENIRALVKDLIGFYVIMEGIFFYGGFAMLLAMKQQNKLTAIGQQIEFILRDESMHLKLGNHIIETIIQENPDVWSSDFRDEIVSLVRKAVELERAYVHDACPDGMLGINAGLFAQYVEYIADRRLERLNLPSIYRSENPFKWMSTQVDISKEKNFFETRVTEYQTGTLSWDD